MESIKFKKTDWIIIAIVIVFIICVIIWEDKRVTPESPEESRISKLSRTLKELEQQIETEMQSLKLTQEMKIFVDKKIANRLIVAKIAFIVFNLFVMGSFYFNGQDILTSIFSGVGVVGLTFSVGSFLMLSKFVDPNSMIEAGQELIRKWVCKKYGFDPLKEGILLQSINEGRIQSGEVMNEIQRIAITSSQAQDQGLPHPPLLHARC